jgi:hypothetical protein
MRRDIAAQLVVPRIGALAPGVAGFVPGLIGQEITEEPRGTTPALGVLALLRVLVGHILSLWPVARASRLAAGPRSSGDRASVS